MQYILPKELWKQILLELQHNNICLMIYTCKYFDKLCKEENFLKLRKFKGFPRLSKGFNSIEHEEGHSEIHDVSINKDVLLSMNISEDHEYYKSQSLVLDEIYKTNVNLIRGDFIMFDKYNQKSNVFIFDGIKIIKIIPADFFDSRHVPQDFTVINHDVPIFYWYNISTLIGWHNIWFDHRSVREQCISNIKYEEDYGQYETVDKLIMTTYFEYKNIKYVILCRLHYFIFDTAGINREDKLEQFKETFVSNTYLSLTMEHPDESLSFYSKGSVVLHINLKKRVT